MYDEGPLLRASQSKAPLDVVGVGEISLDVVVRIDRWPNVGDKAFARDRREQPGGQIATAILGCARVGLRTALLGAVGGGGSGRLALEPLASAGVDVGGVRVIEGLQTRTAFVFVRDTDGERTVLAHRDSGLTLRPEADHAELIRGARLVMADTTDLDATHWAIDQANRAGIPVMLDADAFFPGWESLLRRVEFPVVSRHFADELGQSRDPRACLEALGRLGATGAVVTLGEGGAIGRFADEIVQVPAYSVGVRDTTGAGDAFHAGFAWGLLEGRSAQGCMRVACAVAALNCTGSGAQEGLPDAGEVAALMNREGDE